MKESVTIDEKETFTFIFSIQSNTESERERIYWIISKCVNAVVVFFSFI